MIGDDIEANVAGARAGGLKGALVRTGKFRPADLKRPVHPDFVSDNIADLPPPNLSSDWLLYAQIHTHFSSRNTAGTPYTHWNEHHGQRKTIATENQRFVRPAITAKR